MRVSIGRFLRFGTRAQFGAQAHTIVQIAGIGGKQFLEDQQKLPEVFFTIVEGSAERLIQVSSRGMEGTAERLSISREDITVLRTDARCDIDKIEAGAGGEVQENFSGLRRHCVSPRWLRTRRPSASPTSPSVTLRSLCRLRAWRRQEHNRARHWDRPERHGKAA